MNTVSCEIDHHIAILTIQNPPANVLSSELLDDLSYQLDNIENDNGIKSVLLTGKDKFFSAGADIHEFMTLQTYDDYRLLSEKAQIIFNRIEQFSIPIIAAIHGAALGGGLELAMACHIRYTTSNAKLGLPEVSLGIIPGFAGTKRLPQYVGTGKAYEMILSGDPVSGEEAKQAGLVNQVFDSEESVYESALTLAHNIASKSFLSITAVIELMSSDKNENGNTQIQKEAQAFADMFNSDDAYEGMRAFIDKREPKFEDN